MSDEVRQTGHQIQPIGLRSADWAALQTQLSPIPLIHRELSYIAGLQSEYVLVLRDNCVPGLVGTEFRPIDEWAAANPGNGCIELHAHLPVQGWNVLAQKRILACPVDHWPALYYFLNQITAIDATNQQVCTVFLHAVVFWDLSQGDREAYGWRAGWIEAINKAMTVDPDKPFEPISPTWPCTLLGPWPRAIVCQVMGGSDARHTGYIDSASPMPCYRYQEPDPAAVHQTSVVFPRVTRG